MYPKGHRLAWIDQRQTEYARVRGEAIRLVKIQLEEVGVTMPSPEFLVRMTTGPLPATSESRGADDAGATDSARPLIFGAGNALCAEI